MSRILIALGVIYLIFCFVVVFSAWIDPNTDWEYRPEEDDDQIDFIKKWEQEREQRKKK